MPMRLSELLERLKPHGVTCEKPSSGSHWKLRKPGYRVYTVPAHNGLREELPDRYLRAACRALGIDRDVLLKK